MAIIIPRISDEVREELEGFVEAWRDDAANAREIGNPGELMVARTYDECAGELEAMLARIKNT